MRIHMASDQTQVTFASANAGVREALESQQHRLRDMFSQQGMNQVNVNVSDQSLARGWQGQQQGGNARGGGNAATGRDAADDEPLISGVRNPQPAAGGRPGHGRLLRLIPAGRRSSAARPAPMRA
jgi:flagellar hook-length control protein FliK